MILAVGFLSACTSSDADTTPGTEASPPVGSAGTQASSGTEAAPSTEASSDAVAVPETTDPELLPLAWFIGRGFSPHVSGVGDALDLLTNACMTEAGFDVPDPTEETASGDRLRYWYGLTDPDEAAVDGYIGSNPDNPYGHAESITDEEAMAAISPDPARQQAWVATMRGDESDWVYREVVNPITGVSHGRVGLVGGCAGQARTTVYGGVEGYLTVRASYDWLRLKVREIHGEAASAVRDAAEAWLACMTANGYPSDHRFWGGFMAEHEGDDYLGEIPGFGPSPAALPEPRPSSEGVAMAIADTACKEESGWTSAMFETEYRLQSELAAAAAEFIATARTVEDAAVANATEVLNQG